MRNKIFGWFSNRNDAAGISPPSATVPDGVRMYAVGDIHGRCDLLDRLIALIDADDRASTVTGQAQLVLLGDYINRGPQSRDVVARVRALVDRGAIALGGNHEEVLCRLWHGNDTLAGLFHRAGGRATMLSYGADPDAYDAWDLSELAEQVRAIIPEQDIDFLDNLPETHRAGDYLFVHAGIRPGVAMGQQRRADLRWIREEFTRSSADHGCVVVHGHTIVAEPEDRPNRIGVDTGAYASGRLCAVRLEGATRRFIHT